MLSSFLSVSSIYTISSSSSPLPRRGREGALRALARARRFLKSIAIKVEIALITTMIIIQSGSCSYIIQSPVTVLFSMTVCVRVHVCVLFILSHNTEEMVSLLFTSVINTK